MSDQGCCSKRFAGKNVILTGAGSGIGLATAELIIRDGGQVLAVDMSQERLAEAAERLGEAYNPLAIDITSQDAASRIVSAAKGTTSILINNAGIMDGFLPLVETDDATWERVLAVNLTATMRLTREVLPQMLEASKGTIVNVSSEATLRTCAGLAYTVSKWGVSGLTKNIAAMYAHKGIRCNAVAPGGVKTNVEGDFKSTLAAERLGSILAATTPAVAEPMMLAQAICYLADDQAAQFINGVVLPVDGGWDLY